MNDQFAEAIFHKPHTVCGVRLYPFTFAHAAALDFAKSPYATLRGRASLDDVVFALAVCSHPGTFPIKLPRMGFFATRRLTRAVYDAGLANAHAAFLNYLSDYNCPPSMWESEGSRSVKCPWMLYFVALLTRHGRMTHEEAWATEVGYGRWFSAALSEAGGNEVRIITDAEREALKEGGHNA